MKICIESHGGRVAIIGGNTARFFLWFCVFIGREFFLRVSFLVFLFTSLLLFLIDLSSSSSIWAHFFVALHLVRYSGLFFEVGFCKRMDPFFFSFLSSFF